MFSGFSRKTRLSLSSVTGNRKGLSAIARPVAALGIAALMTGCSLSSGLNTTSEPEIITSSVTTPLEPEGVDATDAEIIKSAVTGSPETPQISDSHLLAWSNPETGNSGTITAIDDFVGKHGQSCKKFTTTVDSFMGISLYNGETCELKKGFWVLSWFLRATGS